MRTAQERIGLEVTRARVWRQQYGEGTSHKCDSAHCTFSGRVLPLSYPLFGLMPFFLYPPPLPHIYTSWYRIQKNAYVWQGQVLSFDLHQSQSSINKQENHNCNNCQIMSAFQLKNTRNMIVHESLPINIHTSLNNWNQKLPMIDAPTEPSRE